MAMAIFCALALPATTQDQPSLGDVAKTQRQKKTAAKVIDEDEMDRRGIHHDVNNAAFECDTECAVEAKNQIRYSKSSLATTESQLQAAFTAAKDDLARGDWSQRLSEIEQEYCRTPGKVDFEKVKSLQNAILEKRFFETRDKHIDVMAAMAHPNDSGAQALEQLRFEGMKDAILKAREMRAMRLCYVPGTQNTSAAH